MKRTRPVIGPRRVVHARALLVLATLAAATAVQTIGSQTPTIRFDDLVQRTGATYLVSAATVAYDRAAATATRAAYPGAPTLSLAPEVAFRSPNDGAFAEEIAIGAALSLSLPFGLSSSADLNAQTAARAAATAATDRDASYAAAFADAMLRYDAAWLAQEEARVRALERDAAAEQLRAIRDRFQQGEVSLTELSEYEDALTEAETARIEAVLAQRIAWLELAYAVGLDSDQIAPEGSNQPDDVNADDHAPALSRVREADATPLLEPLTVSGLQTVPRPPDLTEWAWRNHPSIRALNDRIEANRAADAALSGFLLPPTFRVGVQGWDQSATLAVNTGTSVVDLAYRPPSLTAGTISSTTSGGNTSADEDTWELTVGVTVPVQGAGGRTREEAVLTSDQDQLIIERDMLRERIALEIRSGFQQLIVAGERRSATEATIEVARQLLDTVLARRPEQRATLADELTARAQLARAELRSAEAQIAERRATLELAAAGAWLTPLLSGVPAFASIQP